MWAGSVHRVPAQPRGSREAAPALSPALSALEGGDQPPSWREVWASPSLGAQGFELQGFLDREKTRWKMSQLHKSYF